MQFRQVWICSILILLVPTAGLGQNGNAAFAFLNLPQTARGGVLNQPVAAPTGTDMWQHNPALADSASQPWAMVGFLPFYAGITQLNAAYSLPAKQANSFYLASVRYIGYGKFDGYDATGAKANKFSAADWQVGAGYSWQWANFRAGAKLNWVSSGIENYRASAFTLDAGGSFQHPNKDLSIGLLVSNLGVVLGRYEQASLNLPLNVQVGMAIKPEGMPFRFYVTGHHLQKGQVQAKSPNNPGSNGFGKVMQHVNIGTEVVFSKHAQLRLGYNYLRRQELKLTETSGGAGISLGFGFRTKRFGLDVGRQWYHAAGGRTQLTLAFNTKNLF